MVDEIHNPNRRECGSCTECCTLLDVPELDAPEGKKCRHQGPWGCGIHKKRPAMCRTFTCAWREGLLSDDKQPDKTGMLIWVCWIKTPQGGDVETIQCNMRPGVERDAETMALLIRYSHNLPVFLVQEQEVELFSRGKSLRRFHKNMTVDIRPAKAGGVEIVTPLVLPDSVMDIVREVTRDVL